MSGKAPAGAWGKAPSQAVRAAPPKGASMGPPSQRSSSGGGGSNEGGGGGSRQRGGGGRGGRGRGGGGRGGGHYHDNRRGSGSHGGGGGNKSRTNLANVKLCSTGDGTTEKQKKVQRYPADMLLQLRLVCLDPAEKFNPPPPVHWNTEEREDAIVAFHNARRKGGDVTPRPPKRPPPKDTAPPLEECAPIAINEETRWKAKHMEGDSDKKEEDTDEVVLKKALLILNKLSLTTFDKLSQEMVDLGIARNEACLKGIIELIVENAHVQPHFASMYALLCAQLSAWQVGGKKVFKKMLLTQCQLEFEKDTSAKVQEMILNIEDEEEREYQAALIKKNYLGHMRFIGELYKNDMIKIDIMLWCLKTLLEDDEEQLECFAKLMTTSGGSLEQQALALRDTAGKPASWEQLQECWKVVEKIAKKGPSARIRFMLLDLLDLRDNGWVERRQKETAKTVDQIRKEHAKEERNRASGSMPSKPKPGLGRRSSTGDVRNMDRKPVVDSDGFTQVARTSSSSNIMGSSSLAMAASGKKKPSDGMRRSVSVPSSSPAATEKKEAVPAKTFPSADECGEKTKKILVEYFVGGDTEDAVLSIDEMVGFGHDGSIERGAKVIEGGTLLVLEMKEEEVNKFLTILLRCLKENKIQRKSVATGMGDPLEFLSDIEIDAPLARKHLVHIVAELMKEKAVHIDFLLESPDYFREEGKAASFAAKVLKATGEEITDADVAIIEQLMTEDDKSAHASARALLDSI